MSPSAIITTPARPVRHAKMDKIAGRLAVLGATLGVLAGVVDVAVGGSIRDWIGNKLNPTPLGVVTVILSAVALAGAVQWERPGGRAGDRRLATVLAFLIPAVICFTTIGRLWYLPGVLLLGAAVLIVSASTHEELAHAANRHHWLNGLTTLLGAYYIFLGGDALPKAAGVLGILGGLAIWGALLATRDSHRVALTLLAAGALPFAIATWWSVVTPIIAVLVLTIGHAAIRRSPPAARTHSRPKHRPQPKAASSRSSVNQRS